jgi:hypothetical protein
LTFPSAVTLTLNVNEDGELDDDDEEGAEGEEDVAMYSVADEGEGEEEDRVDEVVRGGRGGAGDEAFATDRGGAVEDPTATAHGKVGSTESSSSRDGTLVDRDQGRPKRYYITKWQDTGVLDYLLDYFTILRRMWVLCLFFFFCFCGSFAALNRSLPAHSPPARTATTPSSSPSSPPSSSSSLRPSHSAHNTRYGTACSSLRGRRWTPCGRR